MQNLAPSNGAQNIIYSPIVNDKNVTKELKYLVKTQLEIRKLISPCNGNVSRGI